MEPGGKEGEDFDGSSFHSGGAGFVELLGGGEIDGVSELLNIDGGEEGFLGLRSSSPYPPPSSSPSSSSFRMLCFGGEDSFRNNSNNNNSSSNNGFFPQKSSESTSSTSSSSGNSSLSKAKKAEGRRRNSAAAGGGRKTTSNAAAAISTTSAASTTTTTTTSTAKKPRKEQQQQPTTSRGGGGALKVRKEKLGERISTLQQLVSPFGKSDTASVLHEALGYIRFLHDQIQVLSSPYLQRLPSSAAHLHEEVGGAAEETKRRSDDLRSRGLCLVPVSCTVHVAGSNGADYWSPPMGGSEKCFTPAVFKH